MELDDLKKSWNQSQITHNQNIMSIIQHTSEGPVAALKRSFKKQIILMTLVPLMLVVTNLNNVLGVFNSILFISYVAFCLAVILFSLMNYAFVRKMEGRDVAVKSNLEGQVKILETRLRWHIVGFRLALLYFVVMVEIVPFLQDSRLLNVWHSIHPALRILCYILLFILQYYLSRKVSERKFGSHVRYLKELVKEMN